MSHRLAIAPVLLWSCFALAQAPADAGLPRGWYVSGASTSYEVVNLESGACGRRSVKVTSKAEPKGPIGVLQAFRADEFRGQRVRYSATIDATGVDGWSGLFFRADAPGRQTVAFDDMQTRPVRGTVHCARVSVVADVPPAAEMLALGIGLHGAGTVELSDVVFEQVSPQVESTSGVRQTDGRVNSVWFTDSLLTVFQSKVGGKLSRRSPGDWRDDARDVEARIEGERVVARLFKADTGSSAVMLTGEFTIDHEAGVTTIEGTWGTVVARYPVLITISQKQLDMKWGFYERHLKQEPSAQLAPDCRFYGEKASLTQFSDRVELCGAVLSATPPPVQTVMAFLVTGFRRGE
jgi:hypothetical protein